MIQQLYIIVSFVLNFALLFVTVYNVVNMFFFFKMLMNVKQQPTTAGIPVKIWWVPLCAPAQTVSEQSEIPMNAEVRLADLR